MDSDKPENVLCNSHKTKAENVENSDIQKIFYAQLEEKGIINNTLAYFRGLFIRTLKDDTLWISNTTKFSSLKDQAFNLLVADFLMNRTNLFTLSVFITEVPSLGNIHELKSYVNHLGSNIQNRPITKPTFQLNVVRDNLVLLGFQPNSDVIESTCQYYFDVKNNQINSLFECLLKAMTTIRNNSSEYEKVQGNTNCLNKFPNIEYNSYENWIASIEDFLRSLDLNEIQTSNVEKFLKRSYQMYNHPETSVHKKRLEKLEEKNKKLEEKVTELDQMLALNFHTYNRNLLFQKELQLEKQQLYEETKSTKEKLNKAEEDNNKHVQFIENLKNELKLKEMEISKFKEESKKHLNAIKTVTILEEQNIDLNKQLKELKLKSTELDNLKQFQLTNFKQIDNNLQRNESPLDTVMIGKLRKENDELHLFIKNLQQRINELSNKKFHCTEPIQRITRNVKKKIPFVYTNQNISSTTTDTDESDTEDDIVKKAHSRLKILEMNTLKAEQNFQTNQMHHYNDPDPPL